MWSIVFLTEAIYCNIFRCNYLRNEKYFLTFFLHFLNLDWILDISQEQMNVTADVFLKLRTPENMVR